ncbi:MAG: tetratricopeptide repeat protein [Ignavibacteria bacterium]
MKKHKLIIVGILILFLGYLFYQLNNYSKIPEHIHSIDDKKPEERTDEENIMVFERTLQTEPTNISIMLQLSELYLKTGQKSKSKDMIDDILKIDPANKEASEKLKQLN